VCVSGLGSIRIEPFVEDDRAREGAGDAFAPVVANRRRIGLRLPLALD
jgi:hypothetical protein